MALNLPNSMTCKQYPLLDAVFGALSRGATIVTSNERAARRLKDEYGRHQYELGLPAWASPAIFDWRGWTDSLWQQWSFDTEGAPQRLTRLQEAELWQQMLGEDAERVVASNSLAELAQKAYALLSSYGAHTSRQSDWQEMDAEHFRQWAARFDVLCEQRNWLSASRAEENLTLAIERGEVALPKELCVVGFDRMLPSQQALCEQARRNGMTLTDLTAHEGLLNKIDSSDFHTVPQATVGADTRRQFELGYATDERAEMIACAQWLRDQLRANPQAQLAVLATNIKERRNRMDRVFRAILTGTVTTAGENDEPSATAPSAPTPYEFTLGHPLAEHPMVHAALLALDWLTAPLEQPDATWLLLSGFLGHDAQERTMTAKLDAWLRRNARLHPVVSLAALLVLGPQTETTKRPGLPKKLYQRLKQGLEFATKNHFLYERRLPGNWCELVRRVLVELGWGSGIRRSTGQQQALKQWEKTLDEVAQLDLFEKPIAYKSFLSLLHRQMRERLFSQESANAKIQIMGPMEAAGQFFDGLWFLGVTDATWPATGRPHPLLPIHVQRGANMPHATKEDDWLLAQQVTERIRTQCVTDAQQEPARSRLIASYARRNQDGELRPSSLLLACATPAKELQPLSQHSLPEALESVAEPTLDALKENHTQGGSSLLRDQAQCPFRSFALHRLRASTLEQPCWGLNAQQRGTLLHDVLRRFWQESEPRHIAGLDALQELIAEHRLNETLRFHIEKSFEPFTSQAEQLSARDPWLQAYLKLEQQRLEFVLSQWLEFESKRQSFLIEACEMTLTKARVGPLELTLQIDRIDKLEDGSLLLIDYKTGDVRTQAWDQTRPTEPQLPLYATFGEIENLGGVVFAKINARERAFAGHLRDAKSQLQDDLSERDALATKPLTDKMLEGWQRAIQALAEEFSSGKADVRPQQGDTSCLHCPLPSLCRIHELKEYDPESLTSSSAENENE